jgi:YD repeat-containing protein
LPRQAVFTDALCSLAGNRTQLTYPDGRVVTNTYDADNRLVQIEDWDGGLTRYAYDAAGRLISTTLPNGVVTTRQYDDADRQVRLTHTAADDTVLSDYQYQLDGVGNHLQVVETLTGTTRVISNTHDPLNRLIESEYSTSEQFEYVYDAVGNRTLVTSTTPLSGTVVTTYTYDAANRLTNRVRSDGRAYTYDWSNRGQMLTEWTEGLPVRTFDYDSAGRLAQARVLTLTTRFTYDGDGARRVVEVVGHGTTTYTLDYGRGNRILAEETVTGTLLYLYGRDCLGQYEGAEDEWLYYLNDATGYVRQGADAQGEVMSSWLFDPDGTMLEGPQGLVSHLICGGVYDWSTGLIFKGGGYFDPNLGIWLALVPLVMIQSWRGRKRKRRRGMPWYVVAIFVCVGVGGMLTGCGEDGNTLTPGDTPTSTEVCTDIPLPKGVHIQTNTPEPTTPPTPTPSPTPEPEIEWFDEEWRITHYPYVLESDPMFANDEKVTVPGLSETETYRLNFIYGVDPRGPRGVVFQGTGKAENEKYITIDYTKTDIKGSIWNFVFTYGKGGAYAQSTAWETVGAADPRLTAGEKVKIEAYPDKVFTVTDTGTALDSCHLDVFVGEMELAKADALGTKFSRVGKVVGP